MNKSLLDIATLGYSAATIYVIFVHYLASNRLDRLQERIDDKYVASLILDEYTAYNRARLSNLEEQYKFLEKEVNKKGFLAMVLMTGGVVLLFFRDRLGI